MAYRALTEEEITTFIEEHAMFLRWQAYAAHALQVYGPNAARITVTSDLVYNDETDVLRIIDLSVFDASGAALEPDWSSDWGQTALAAEQAILASQPWRAKEWDDIPLLALDRARDRLPVPPRRDDVPVHAPPPRRFPVVYVPEED